MIRLGNGTGRGTPQEVTRSYKIREISSEQGII